MHCIFTEFYGICIYEEIFYRNACFPFFTEFYGICIYELILYQNACFEFYGISRIFSVGVDVFRHAMICEETH